jgi:hypothetical protein
MTGALSHEEEIDREALLSALVLAPLTFPRNRFFRLFTRPWARRTRFRAAQIRSILRHLSAPRAEPTRVHALSPDKDGGVELRYSVRDLGLRRTAMLDRLEIALLRFALARAGCVSTEPAMTLTDEDRQLVEEAIAKLGRELGLGAVAGEMHAPDTGGS